jgi:hypothetical protein
VKERICQCNDAYQRRHDANEVPKTWGVCLAEELYSRIPPWPGFHYQMFSRHPSIVPNWKGCPTLGGPFSVRHTKTRRDGVFGA